VNTPPGTQPERTRLSWRRTVLAATVVTLLVARLSVPALALAVLDWLAVLVLAQRRISALSAGRTGVANRVPLAAAAAVFGYAVLGALFVLLHTG